MSNFTNNINFSFKKLPYTHPSKNGVNNPYLLTLFGGEKLFKYKCTIQGTMDEVTPIVTTHWYSGVEYSDYGNFVEMTVIASKYEGRRFKKQMKMEFGERMIAWKRLGPAD
jgi:hypothetical protein